MSRLSLNEIDELLYNENSDLSKENKYGDCGIPEDARSKFSYDIEESLDDLEHNMRRRACKNEERGDGDWVLIDQDGKTELHDPWGDSNATVVRDGHKMEIGTAWSQNLYSITEDDKGTHVEFAGPVNGLGVQKLLPEMTYVPGTLQGKFVKEGEFDRSVLANRAGEDISSYLDMDLYCSLRKQKNHGKENPQDKYGYQVNRLFNNEISGLPKAQKTVQQEKAEEKEGKKDRIRENIEAYRKNGKSGSVKADVIAQALINQRQK